MTTSLVIDQNRMFLDKDIVTEEFIRKPVNFDGQTITRSKKAIHTFHDSPIHFLTTVKLSESANEFLTLLANVDL